MLEMRQAKTVLVTEDYVGWHEKISFQVLDALKEAKQDGDLGAAVCLKFMRIGAFLNAHQIFS